jgi:hypothetical protein
MLGGVFSLARTIYTLSARSAHRKADALADKLEARVREELQRG